MALQVRRSLRKLGQDLAIARRRRRLTVAMMLERVGVSKPTWLKMEQGEPTVSLGAYAQAFFALGFGAPLGELIDQRRDEQGFLLELERLPKRVVRRRDDGNSNRLLTTRRSRQPEQTGGLAPDVARLPAQSAPAEPAASPSAGRVVEREP
jgi:transcriptional regulator with XRE-family HTH domain